LSSPCGGKIGKVYMAKDQGKTKIQVNRRFVNTAKRAVGMEGGEVGLIGL
jgi:hypothetical protein